MRFCLIPQNVLIYKPAMSVGLFALMLSSPALYADQFDTVSYSASVGMLYDSNVFRLPSWVDPQFYLGTPSTADTIHQLALGMNINKKYSNQAWLLSANITNNKYDTFTNLDYDGTSYKAAWNWSLGSRFNGSLSADRSQTLNSFADVHTNLRSLRTEFNQQFNVDWWLQSNWHMLASVANNETTSSVTTVNNLSYRTDQTELGVKYLLADNNSVVLLSRNIKGSYIDVSPDYVALLDSGYSETQQVLQFNWILSGKSVVSGNLTNINRSYPLISQRDYSAMQKGINYTWGMTGETQLSISMNENVSPWFATSSSYLLTDTVSVSAGWQLSANTDIQISSMRSTSDYRSPVDSNALIRYDENQSQQIALGWSPQRSVKVSAFYIYSQRSSNYMEYEFTDNSTNLSVQVTF